VSAVEARLAAVEARLLAIEERLSNGTATPTAAASRADKPPEMDPFSDHMLERDWADKAFKKDPKFWNGPSMVGLTMSEASPEYLIAYAKDREYLAWRARNSPEPRKNAKGKFFYESDEFEAKLARAWAARNASRPPVNARVTEEAPEDDALPF
jgi:hypothetical protein